jgi:hypothetical protein
LNSSFTIGKAPSHPSWVEDILKTWGPKLDYHLVLVPLFQKWPHAGGLYPTLSMVLNCKTWNSVGWLTLECHIIESNVLLCFFKYAAWWRHHHPSASRARPSMVYTLSFCECPYNEGKKPSCPNLPYLTPKYPHDFQWPRGDRSLL